MHTTLEAGPWIRQTSGVSYNLKDVSASGATLISVVGQGYALVTSNEGTSWTTVETYGNPLQTSVFFVNETGWAVGNYGTIRFSNDFGNHWFVCGTQMTAETFNSVHFSDINNGWICGTGGVLYRTANGVAGTSASWEALTRPTTQELKSIYFVSSLEGWTAGTNGTILHTTNSGTTWTAQNSETTNDILNLFFINPTLGWASGRTGLILRYY